MLWVQNILLYFFLLVIHVILQAQNSPNMALMILAKDRKKNKFGAQRLHLCAWQYNIWKSFVLLCQHSHVFRRGHVKMFWAPKVHSPLPTEHGLPGQS